MHISNWTASRSGPAMTVRGKAAPDGQTMKIGNIGRIEVRGGLVIAIERDGHDEHILQVD